MQCSFLLCTHSLSPSLPRRVFVHEHMPISPFVLLSLPPLLNTHSACRHMSMPTSYDPDGDVHMDSVPAAVKDSSIDPLEVILNPALLKSKVSYAPLPFFYSSSYSSFLSSLLITSPSCQVAFELASKDCHPPRRSLASGSLVYRAFRHSDPRPRGIS